MFPSSGMMTGVSIFSIQQHLINIVMKRHAYMLNKQYIHNIVFFIETK